MKRTDIIVVGQGIAGSVLALALMNEGKSVIVIDSPGLSNCSKAAGGIYNPVVFKRLTQSWMAEMVLPAMVDFYEELEIKFSTKLLYPVKIARLFANTDEENLWKKKAINELSEFIEKDIHEPFEKGILGGSNYSFVNTGGYLDVPKFLEECRRFFEQRNAYMNEKFNYDQVRFEGDSVVYNTIFCNKVIFCEGSLCTQNPWFGHLQFKPAKGEVLTIFCKDLETRSIINKDIFILPLAQPNHFKVGATYNWDERNDEATPAARDILESKLRKLISYKYKVVNQEAGVRPSTIDRRPVIGFLPENRHLGIFNGFGTKAVMLAPYFAKHFCSFMENKTPLLHEVDLRRFQSKKQA